MKVYVYPMDLAGCGYYRMIWPAKVLQGMGHDVKLVHPSQQHKIGGGLDANGKLVQVTIPDDADVMVFQRLSSRHIVDGIEIMRQHGVAVVIDIDDDMSCIHPSNPAWAILHPKSTAATQEYNWANAQRACENATLVTVSTDALLRRYAHHGRGVVLRNCVPEVLLKIKQPKEPRTIGWGGSIHSHPDDPQVCGPAMGRLQHAGYKFKVVGPPRKTKIAFQLHQEPSSTDIVPIGAYPHELAKLTVGIAPLADTKFNQSKSWLKMLEYAGVGVPCIGSPRAEYRLLHARGVGLLADNPREWFKHAKTLLDDESRRTELSEAGRAAVKLLTIEANAWRWWEAWSMALEMQRGPLGIWPDVPAGSRLPDRG